MRISDWSSDVCSSDLTKTDTPLLEVPQSISIITARDLQDRGLHAVDEAMWYVAGAQGGVYGMDTRSEWLLVRGFQPARYLDGLALPTGPWSGPTLLEPSGMRPERRRVGTKSDSTCRLRW